MKVPTPRRRSIVVGDVVSLVQTDGSGSFMRAAHSDGMGT
jgi:hypothetical protein